VTYHRYGHAKLFIIDDELAIIGSANINNRGYFYDSEVVGVIADPKWDEPNGPRQGKWYMMELNLARKLRMQLWAHHLCMDTDALFDGVAAGVHWRRIPDGANVAVYPYVAGSHEPFNAAKSVTFDWTLLDPK
jgi:phosphatidylserine/phosphatidylglycerophosphate/cardiolipin synthase-like enzyme